jgi:hypothetical protein
MVGIDRTADRHERRSYDLSHDRFGQLEHEGLPGTLYGSYPDNLARHRPKRGKS